MCVKFKVYTVFSLPTISVGHIVGAHKGLAVHSCGMDREGWDSQRK